MLIFAFIFVFKVSAATLIVDENGTLQGIDGLEVGGSMLDVRFFDGTIRELYPSLDDLFFKAGGFSQVSINVFNSSSAILAALKDGPLGNFDSDPSLISGCGPNPDNECIIINTIDYSEPAFGTDANRSWSARNSADESRDTVFTGRLDIDYDLASDPRAVQAQWFNSTVVPLPGGLVLLISGLIFLRSFRG